MTESQRLAMLGPPRNGILPVVMDTDTYNEVDDQFALAYALLSPERLCMEAIYAAPFLNKRSTSALDGMEKSYAEILRLRTVIPGAESVPVFRGAGRFMDAAKLPVHSEAVADLITRGMQFTPENPLYIIALGAITNIASALLLEPELADRCVVIWLGGHPTHWSHTREFNLWEDVSSAQVVLGSGVPLVLCPCFGVASHLLTTTEDLKIHLTGKNTLCDMLIELFSAYRKDHFAWAKEIWDMLPVAWLVNPDVAPSKLAHTPHLSPDGHWAADYTTPLMREITYAHRNMVFADMYHKLPSF